MAPNFSSMTEQINFMDYHNKNCIYMFHTTIKSDTDQPILKIGFTNNLFDRIKSLEKHYRATFRLIKIKLLDRLSDEKLFHKMIRLKYGDEFVYDGIFKKTRGTELYYYDERLLNEFDKYECKDSHNFSLHIHINKEEEDNKMSDVDYYSDSDSDSDYVPPNSSDNEESDGETVESDTEPMDESTDSEEEPEPKRHKSSGWSILDRWEMDQGL